MSLSIIHFSDIHLTGNSDKIIDYIDALKKACAGAIPNESDVVIAVTGDIAFSGTKDQYNQAKKMFEKISAYLEEEQKANVEFVFVPGNHDCDFSFKPNVRERLIRTLSSEIDNELFEEISTVQKEYNEFAASFSITTSEVCPLKEFTVSGGKVLFVLVNTSWMSVLKENPGKIIMPTALFPKIDSSEYKAVFFLYHHPDNWLNPDHSRSFTDYIRKNADFILVGHEHQRDSYTKSSESFSVFCSHGKELQNSIKFESAFSVINFDDQFQKYEIIDFSLEDDTYKRNDDKVSNLFHKNIARTTTVYQPNATIMEYAYDMGFTINHFSKENVVLTDLYVWPEMDKISLQDDKSRGAIRIRDNIYDELSLNSLNIIVGNSSVGKTALSKILFLMEERKDSCCLLVEGSVFTSSNIDSIKESIEKSFINEYQKDSLDDFYSLEKEKRSIVVDGFELIKNNNNRRNVVIDYLCGFFGSVTIVFSSSTELTTILTSKALRSSETLFYYEILPLGNKKRKQLISKWYNLSNTSNTEEEIENRIELAEQRVNTFLGNGAAFIPALPLFIIGVLQNGDAISPSYNGSKYGFLFESMLSKDLHSVSSKYLESGENNIVHNTLAALAFFILKNRKAHFSFEEFKEVLAYVSEKYIVSINQHEFLEDMIRANIICEDRSNGNMYRFKYPYIYYFFAGKYIAYNINDPDVISMVDEMSKKLYNETFGNVIIFVCHFSGNERVINSILTNAYETLKDREQFDFSKNHPIFSEISEVIDSFIPKEISDDEVEKNKEERLSRLDEAGINDGQMRQGEDIINDDVDESERDLASISASLKIMEVLGQILKNYPMGVVGETKKKMIDEMHSLGMRSVQAIINTMGYLEKDLVEMIYEKQKENGKIIHKEEIGRATHRFINVIITGMARGMIHQIAESLNDPHILEAAKITFKDNDSISSKLVLLDLKLNCLNQPNYDEVKGLKTVLDSSNEFLASKILDSIVGRYLTYNRCDYRLKQKLCKLCGFSLQSAITAEHMLLSD